MDGGYAILALSTRSESDHSSGYMPPENRLTCSTRLPVFSFVPVLRRSL